MKKSHIWRSLTTSLPFPKDDTEVDNLIAQLAGVDIQIEEAEIEFAYELKRIEKRFARRTRGKNRRLIALLTTIFDYLDLHKERLIGKEEKKTIRFNSGEASWRMNPKSVRLSNEDLIIKLLERRGLHDCIKVVKNVKKRELLQVLLSGINKIRGVTIVQDEELAVKPNLGHREIKHKRSQLPKLRRKSAET